MRPKGGSWPVPSASSPTFAMRKLAHRAFSNAYLLLTLMALFWAGNSVIGRAVAGHVPPIALAWNRWFWATLIVTAVAWPYLKRDWPAIRASLPLLIFLGILGVGCFNTFLYIALNSTTAINGTVLQSSGPVLIALACFMAFGDRLSWLQMAGIGISLVGVIAIVTEGEPERLARLALNRGDVWVMAALVTWSVYTAYLRRRPQIHWLSFAAVTFCIGVVVNTPFFLVEHLSGWRLQGDLVTVLTICYVAVFPSIFSYIFFNRGVELIGGPRSGAFLHLVPLFGIVLAILFLGEALRLFHVAGFVLILAGVALTARGRERTA